MAVRSSTRNVENMKQLLSNCVDVRLRYQTARQFHFVDVVDDILSDDSTATFLRDPAPHHRVVAFKH